MLFQTLLLIGGFGKNVFRHLVYEVRPAELVIFHGLPSISDLQTSQGEEQQDTLDVRLWKPQQRFSVKDSCITDFENVKSYLTYSHNRDEGNPQEIIIMRGLKEGGLECTRHFNKYKAQFTSHN